MLLKSVKRLVQQKKSFSTSKYRLSAESHALREKFLQDKEITSFSYLGMNIASSHVSTRSAVQKEIESKFYISKDFESTRSEPTRDVLARIHLNYTGITLANWTTLGIEDGQEELFDEFENSKKQAKELVKTLDESEKKVVEDAIHDLEHIWDIALKVERIATFLDGLKNKYHNQYVSTKYDGHVFKGLVENVLKLKNSADGEVEQRNINELMDQIVYLEGKVIVPELRIEYPALFK
jgi:hypothetical protein